MYFAGTRTQLIFNLVAKSAFQILCSGTLGAGVLFWVVAASCAGADDQRPVLRVLDDRLEISVFAEAPQIVTPTGIAVDREGNVLVIESHTHFPKDDYDGPKEDRIKRFRDNNGDGQADEVSEFYIGGVATMNLAVHPNGYVYVATRDEVFRLRDADDDGEAETRESLVKLETEGSYPHNGLSGFAFDFNGDVYFGMGENLGVDYTLIGKDNVRLRGGGEGGNVFRVTASGAELERIATGFWNPFHLCFDAYGRLFAVDNDPDSRPPCRLLHIVPGGDYGYRFRNGRKGTHPFTAWFGENPGTLGLVAETGEAPSGVLAYESNGLPADYRGSLISGSWGNHTIERFRLQQRGASFQAAAEPIIKGDRNFRPVGIAVAPDGSLLISDWVDRSYNVHGKGRIWRIRRRGSQTTIHDIPKGELASQHAPARNQAIRERLKQDTNALLSAAKAAADPKLRAAAYATAAYRDSNVVQRMYADPSADVRALAVRIAEEFQGSETLWKEDHESTPLEWAAVLRRLDAHRHPSEFLNAAKSSDPFIRQAARYAMTRSAPTEQLLRWLTDPAPAVRRAAGLVLRQRLKGAEAERTVTTLIADPDSLVRFVGIQWAGEEKLERLQPIFDQQLLNATDGRWIDAYLAALHLIQGGKASDFEKQQEKLLIELLSRDELKPALQAFVLRRVNATNKWWNAKRFSTRLVHPSPIVRLETIRTLYDSTTPNRGQMLLEVASRSTEERAIREAAVAGLSPEDANELSELLEWATSDGHPLQLSAIETLQGSDLDRPAKNRLAKAAERSPLPADLFARLTQDQWQAKRRWKADDRPQWEQWLEARKGNAARGERIFFHPRGPKCYRCHRVAGRGGAIGPDLSSIHSLKPARLLHSILAPSDEIAPQYTPWRVELQNGKVYVGLLVTEKGDDQTFANEQGETRVIKREEIELRTPLNISVMPVGLVNQLTDQELRDLVAYLASTKN